MNIVVIADGQTALAFGLAGLRTRVAQYPSEIPGLLGAVDRGNTGLVLITEALAQGNREVIERMLLEPGGPLVLEIPDTGGPRPERASAAERIVSSVKR